MSQTNIKTCALTGLYMAYVPTPSIKANHLDSEIALVVTLALIQQKRKLDEPVYHNVALKTIVKSYLNLQQMCNWNVYEACD